MTYPNVRGELETIAAVATGLSLARFGDGELKMALGHGYRRQSASLKLAEELTRIIGRPNGSCIVGIPTMDDRGPKIENWRRHENRFMRVVSPDVQYYSCFVTRPDSAPWIGNVDYARSVVDLWTGKRATVLCERKGSMFRAVRHESSKIAHVECPRYSAYDIIDEFERRILETDPDIVVMSCGPTATCLADRLSAKGVHAVDLGSMGGFLCRTLYS